MSDYTYVDIKCTGIEEEPENIRNRNIHKDNYEDRLSLLSYEDTQDKTPVETLLDDFTVSISSGGVIYDIPNQRRSFNSNFSPFTSSRFKAILLRYASCCFSKKFFFQEML